MDIESQSIEMHSQSGCSNVRDYHVPCNVHPPNVTYHLSSEQSNRRKSSQMSVKKSGFLDSDNENQFQDSLIDDLLSKASTSKHSVMLKSNQNGGYYEQLAKIKKFKGKNKDYFQQVIVEDIKHADNIFPDRKLEVIQLYRALCIFSSTNVLFYKRLYKHELQFSLSHSDPKKNIYDEPDEMLPRLKELIQGHLKVGAGIQNIRSFYNSNQIVKDQYSTLLHSLLRVVFSKVRDFIIFRHPKLSFLLNTIKPGTARFNYSNAVSISLLHAAKEFSPSMNACYQKIIKVVYYYGGVQDVMLEDVEALFELLRERNEQHLVPMRLQEMKKSQIPTKKLSPAWSGFIPYVPYSEPQCDADFQVQKPSESEIFQKCESYTTRNWTVKFERYVLALYMKHQNFLDIKQLINHEYRDYLGKEFDLEQLRGKFDITMKKLIIYLQLQLYYIIRRTNVSKLQNYKVDFPTKKFLTFNKNQKRAIFNSENAKNCRLFIIDYYLNNFQRRTKSYKMSLINYRLSYLSLTIDAIMTFLMSKIGECGILIESQLEKEDTYPLKLINNAYFSIIKSILKEFLISKSIKTYDQGEKMVKNPNAKRSIYNSAQIDKVFDELRPDDLMEIENLYLMRRNKSLIVKRNPKMFPNFKLTKTLQQGLVEEEWDTLMLIMDRRGRIDQEDEELNVEMQKFQTAEGVDIEDDNVLNIDTLKKGTKPLTTKSQYQKKFNPYKLSSVYKQKSADQQFANNIQKVAKTVYETETEQTRKKNKAQYMTALKESLFIKTEMLILKVNAQKDGFKKYYK